MKKKQKYYIMMWETKVWISPFDPLGFLSERKQKILENGTVRIAVLIIENTLSKIRIEHKESDGRLQI